MTSNNVESLVQRMKDADQERQLRKVYVSLLRSMILLQRTDSFMPIRALHACAFTIIEELEGCSIENIERDLRAEDKELEEWKDRFHGLEGDMRGMVILKAEADREIARLKYKAGESFSEDRMLTQVADGVTFTEAEEDM